MPRLHALIVAAGASRRMGFDKLAAPLAGKPVLWHSVRALASCPEVEALTLVTRPDSAQAFDALARDAAGSKPVTTILGGAERHLSVWAGLQHLHSHTGFVAVHDAARPLLTPAAFSGCLALARKHGAAACAAPVADTLKKADPSGMVLCGIDRSGLWAMQTPQIFEFSLLQRAYRSVLDSGTLVTDEVSALEHIGAQVALFHNPDWNFKITFPAEVSLAELLLLQRGGPGGGEEGSR